VHRVRQFVAHVRARVTPEEAALAHRVLPAALAGLFDGMPVADRRHALDVAGRLLAAGHDDPDLLAAALLHDVAKGHRMRLWHRIAGVLLGAFAPAVLRRLANPDRRSWRHPFHLYLHHADLSAQRVAAAGGSARACAFIRGDAAGEDARLQRALTDADDAS
jgi:hypothetical protein